MATTMLPQSRSIISNRWLAGGIAAIGLAIVGALLLNNSVSGAASQMPATTAVSRGSLVASVAGSGTVAAVKTLDLPFQTGGSVAEVLVEEGDVVAVGQALARLDSASLVLQVQANETALNIAQAREATTKRGPDLNDVASAKARLDAARKSGPSAADIASAQARLDSARRNLADVQNGTDPITKAKQALDQARNNLWAAQADRDGIAAQVENRKASQYQLDAANARVLNAELSVQQAQQAYDTALANQTNTPLAQAQAQVKEAEAALAKLLNSTNPQDVAAAEANYQKIAAGPTAEDLAVAAGNVQTARINLEQAQLNLEHATLKAPFAGVVAAVNIVPGSIVSSNMPAMKLTDRSTLHVDLKLSENDVVKVQLGQPVILTIDSLSDWKAQGKVSYIAPAAKTVNGVVTYKVRVSFADADPRVKVGMTANLNITTAQKDGVLLVPNSVLLPKGAGRAVLVPGADGKTTREVDVQTGLTDSTYTEIITGLGEGERVITVPRANTTRTSGGLFGN